MIDELKNTQENKVCNLAGELFNEILKVDDMQDIEKQECAKQIHIIQDMMLSKLFTKTFGKL